MWGRPAEAFYSHIPSYENYSVQQLNSNFFFFFFYAQHKKWLKRRGRWKEAARAFQGPSHFLLIGLISRLKSETPSACHSFLVLSVCHGQAWKNVMPSLNLEYLLINSCRRCTQQETIQSTLCSVTFDL